MSALEQRLRSSTENATHSEGLGGIFASLRNEVKTALEYGKAVTGAASLIALTGLFYWCPRCGQWMGEGSEGKGAGAPKPEVPPPPPRLLKAIGLPLEGEPTATRDMPRRDGAKLTRNSGKLETPGTQNGEPAKIKHSPPSEAHGRKIDVFYGGEPEPDDRPHGHIASFIRGDGVEIPLYDRLKDDTIVYESGVNVVYLNEGAYEWKPKREG